MRKRLISAVPVLNISEERPWLDLEKLAEVEVTSEDPSRPIENALTSPGSIGWRASTSGTQIIRLTFDEPQSIRHLELLFDEGAVERAQEFHLTWSAGPGEPWREIVRQQYHFSPGGSMQELEHYHVQLDAVRSVELTIIPDRNGGLAKASLTRLRLA